MHDFYAKSRLGERTELIVGFDFGAWQRIAAPDLLNGIRVWFAPSIVAAFKTGERSRIVLRLEHMNDPNGALVFRTQAILPVDESSFIGCEQQPFVVTGASINYDYDISTFAKWRIEARGLYSQEGVFPAMFGSNDANANTLVFFTTSLSVRLFK
jgi:hypothetical protein